MGLKRPILLITTLLLPGAEWGLPCRLRRIIDSPFTRCFTHSLFNIHLLRLVVVVDDNHNTLSALPTSSISSLLLVYSVIMSGGVVSLAGSSHG